MNVFIHLHIVHRKKINQLNSKNKKKIYFHLYQPFFFVESVNEFNRELEMYCNQSFIPPQCARQSVGTANQLFTNLIQTLLAVQCTISPPEMWPKDIGKLALEKGFK